MFGQAESGILPTLKSVLTEVVEIAKEATPVVSKYFELETAKERAKTAKQAQEAAMQIAELQRLRTLQATAISPPSVRMERAGFLSENWPILGIIGIGILLMFRRGEPLTIKAPKQKRRKRRR